MKSPKRKMSRMQSFDSSSNTLRSLSDGEHDKTFNLNKSMNNTGILVNNGNYYTPSPDNKFQVDETGLLMSEDDADDSHSGKSIEEKPTNFQKNNLLILEVRKSSFKVRTKNRDIFLLKIIKRVNPEYNPWLKLIKTLTPTIRQPHLPKITNVSQIGVLKIFRFNLFAPLESITGINFSSKFLMKEIFELIKELGSHLLILKNLKNEFLSYNKDENKIVLSVIEPGDVENIKEERGIYSADYLIRTFETLSNLKVQSINQENLMTDCNDFIDDVQFSEKDLKSLFNSKYEKLKNEKQPAINFEKFNIYVEPDSSCLKSLFKHIEAYLSVKDDSLIPKPKVENYIKYISRLDDQIKELFHNKDYKPCKRILKFIANDSELGCKISNEITKFNNQLRG